ncbi:VENN motif pre-toxin domain-containing protein [Pectobacterium carotovorum]|nr:VENN motif pre-toxin domain-containing protein [Pectobacterium carotovorum]
MLLRDTAKQVQDITTLSRDVEHANNALSPIFNKEKEQKRLKQAQLIGEIGAQVMDIVRTEGELKAQKAAEAKGDSKVKRPEDGDSVAMWEDYKKTLTESPTYKAEMQKYGTGSDFQRAAQAATAAIQALAGGDIQKAIASGASPYLAQLVKDVTIPKDESKITASDIAANAMAHAVVGAVVAQLSGQDAAAGAMGASSGELIARAIMAKVYPGKTTNDLTEEEKQSVSALSTLASGLASNSTASAASGAQSGRNAVENNALSGDKARQSVKESAEWWKNQVRDKLGEGTASSVANGIINAIADSGDATLGSADYVADAAMALASCAAGDGYCSTALNDLSGKNQAVADSVKALMKSETWSAVADTIKQASEGNQAALEATGGMLAGIMLPGKKVPGVAADIGKVESVSGNIIKNDILDNPRVGVGEKGSGSGNKVDQLPNKVVTDIDGKEISIYPDKIKPTATQEFPSVPKSHGFSDIVDNYADSAVKTSLNNGATLYQLEGSLNGVPGRFEWILDPKLGGVSHRMFVSGGTVNGVPSKP